MDSKVAPISTADLQALIGKEIGVSDWMLVDQKRIDTFADAVDDHQFIHVDPERAAKEAPFGGTIAHGFLTLSMIAQMGYQVIAPLENLSMVINYGLDKVRFISAVKVGRARARRWPLGDPLRRDRRDRERDQGGVHLRIDQPAGGRGPEGLKGAAAGAVASRMREHPAGGSWRMPAARGSVSMPARSLQAVSPS